MSQLRHDTLPVVDMDNVTSTATPRVDIAVKDLSAIGATTRSRAFLEGERRFCGNRGEVILGSEVIIGKMERLAMLLDLRTAGGSHVSKDVYEKAKSELREEYVAFGLRCDKYKADQAAAAKAQKELEREKEKEKEKASGATARTSSSYGPASRNGKKGSSMNKGIAYIPGCAHESDDQGDGSSDVSDDNGDPKYRIAELQKEFKKAWKSWKAKMASMDWSQVMSLIPSFLPPIPPVTRPFPLSSRLVPSSAPLSCCSYPPPNCIGCRWTRRSKMLTQNLLL